MWLLLDIGNSSVKAGLFDPMATEKGILTATSRIEFVSDAESQLREMIAGQSIGRIGGVSVVPSQTQVWTELVERICKRKIRFFNEGTPLPFRITYQTPDTLGNDRLAVAAAGWLRYGVAGSKGVIVVDAGTAINYEVVLADGTYPGGVIAPGPGLMRQALGDGTAQLPKADLTIPESRIGRSTEESLRTGIMFGTLDSVRGMVEGIQSECGFSMEVVLTGGWGKWLSERTGYRYEQDLVLKGVADLMRYEAE